MRALALAAVLAAAPADADDFPGASAAALMASLAAQSAEMCSTQRLLSPVSRGIRGPLGEYSAAELADAAKTVYGEASPDSDEQCAVALTIFNRARDSGASLSSVVRAPGQFHGYNPADRKECDKLRGSVQAVVELARGGRCSFGAPRFRFFCSWVGWLRGNRRAGARRIGETAFLINSPC